MLGEERQLAAPGYGTVRSMLASPSQINAADAGIGPRRRREDTARSPVGMVERLSIEDRARMAALLAEVIAAMRAEGREPQDHQFALGTEIAARLRGLAAQGVSWAARVWFAQTGRIDLGLADLLRQQGIDPEE